MYLIFMGRLQPMLHGLKTKFIKKYDISLFFILYCHQIFQHYGYKDGITNPTYPLQKLLIYKFSTSKIFCSDYLGLYIYLFTLGVVFIEGFFISLYFISIIVIFCSGSKLEVWKWLLEEDRMAINLMMMMMLITRPDNQFTMWEFMDGESAVSISSFC